MNRKNIYKCLEERILVLDGGLGTMVQGFGLEEKDYRGDRFLQWEVPLKGCNDLLVLTAPYVIENIHEAYLKAGADIISTDSFNSTSVSLADYRLQDYAYEINYQAASLARKIADKFTLGNPGKPRFVAGSIGPTSKTTSMSADVNNPGSRELTFDMLAEAYAEQIRALLDGGVDILLFETVFDTLNVKAAIFAAKQLMRQRGVDIPIMISGTLADASGRTLSGQVVEAFYASIAHANPLSVGFNCAYGAKQMLPYLERLAEVCEYRISAHPNAGLPNIMGGYDETPEMMAEDVEEYMRRGIINIIGGCCGTTPVHVAEFARKAANYSPRPLPKGRHETVLSGLEPLKISPDSNFVNVGERTNVAGSARFAKMIREDRYEDALAVAREQVDAGAQIIDVCMDDGLIDGVEAMTKFLNLAMSEPEISRVPVMVDSSSWDVLVAGLKCVQGKSIVNSISLKEGEQEFIRKAQLIMDYGAAAVVMLFDEKGQADIYERKIEVAARAYNLLISIGFPAEDIVFDPNVLAVATGIDQHSVYGIDFIRAVEWIKQNLPYAKISGGISNLSFSFRGVNKVREAMHSVFLYHAIGKGLDMGIVNPAMLQVYSDIEPELLRLSEDVVLNRNQHATEALSEYAEKAREEKSSGQTAEAKVQQWRNGTLQDKISYAMMKGVTDFIAEDTMEAYNLLQTPLAVIDNMLMPAMAKIGELFGEGKMFLPQVVKSARVMKKSVEVLTPFMEVGSQGSTVNNGKVLIATVKGDVHDIGKNIVSVVMACNGYQVKDLGVMVECNEIVDAALAWGAEVVGLSGLISPSLDEMIKVVEELERRGSKIPVIIGGATTSELHTAVKIAPAYSGLVVHSRDASENIAILNSLLGSSSEQYIKKIKQKQAELKSLFEEKERGRNRLTLEQARANKKVQYQEDIVVPLSTGRFVFEDYPISEVVEYIDWNYFFPAWELKGHYPEILESQDKGEEARKLFNDARQLLDKIIDEKLLRLNAVVLLAKACSDGDDIVIDIEGKQTRIPMLRNQEQQKDNGANFSLADYIAPKDDYIALFALTAGVGLEELVESYRKSGDDYSAIMAKLLADRLTEAFAEVVHSRLRRELWGYETDPQLNTSEIIKGKYQGLRVAFGYPACPDHSLKKDVMKLLDARQIGLDITDSYMIDPGESLCGMIFANKDAEYFSVGKIDREQLQDYASRRAMAPDEIARLISQHIR